MVIWGDQRLYAAVLTPTALCLRPSCNMSDNVRQMDNPPDCLPASTQCAACVHQLDGQSRCKIHTLTDSV
jgi:hypothetical protein